MSEITKDQIKEAIGFIEEFRKIFGIFAKAEEAVSVLASLHTTASSLGAKASVLRKQIEEYEKRNAALSTEWEKAREEIAQYKTAGKKDAALEAHHAGRMLIEEAEGRRDAIAKEVDELTEKKDDLVRVIVDLAKDREGISLDIKDLKDQAKSEEDRLAGIRAQIEAIKGRL